MSIRPYWSSDCGRATIYVGDCQEVLPKLGPEQFHAVVTDPPYELGFMGKQWDNTGVAFDINTWAKIFFVGKPGAHLLAFGGTRMWHRMAVAIEDAGWEYRDTLMWVYGSGFSKSMDVSKQIDKMYGAERKVVAKSTAGLGDGQFTKKNGLDAGYGYGSEYEITEPATDDAKRWSGWGTALKPAYEPIVMARKPFDDTTAKCVLEHGTGAINIDGCRVGETGGVVSYGEPSRLNQVYGDGMGGTKFVDGNKGRFPANLMTDGSEEQLSRYFYTAKADDSDRPHGKGADTVHPTVKPQSLCTYLVRLVCPKGGIVLDPFMGSGSTGVAALTEGMKFVGVEQSQEYADIAIGRLKLALQAAPPSVELKTREVVDTRVGKLPPPKKLRGK